MKQPMPSRFKSSASALFLALAISPAGSVCAGETASAASHAAAFAEFEALCEADGGALWGRSLCGHVLIVDPETRSVWASRADQAGVLKNDGSGWTGRLPDDVGIANTALDWSGVHWLMVMSPLPRDDRARRVLVLHEAWHGIQEDLGLSAAANDCAHLEAEQGRVLIRLEMRALRTALLAGGGTRWAAARDALSFRSARFDAFAAAGSNERRLDRNEGLAEYTGVRLGAADSADDYAARLLDRFDSHPALARSYAYATGPAYGLLLDTLDPHWPQKLGTNAPADLLEQMLEDQVRPTGAETASSRYGGAKIATEERQRAEAAAVRNASLHDRFIEGPRLELPLGEMRMEFDPNQVIPVDGLGKYYETLVVRDSWGELRATAGAIISDDFKRVIVAQPEPSGMTGPGWNLRLQDGYLVTEETDGIRGLKSE